MVREAAASIAHMQRAAAARPPCGASGVDACAQRVTCGVVARAPAACGRGGALDACCGAILSWSSGFGPVLGVARPLANARAPAAWGGGGGVLVASDARLVKAVCESAPEGLRRPSACAQAAGVASGGEAPTAQAPHKNEASSHGGSLIARNDNRRRRTSMYET